MSKAKAKRGTHDREPFTVYDNGHELAALSVDGSGRLVIVIRKADKLVVGVHDSRRIAGAILEQSVQVTTRALTDRVKRDLRDQLSAALGLEGDENDEGEEE